MRRTLSIRFLAPLLAAVILGGFLAGCGAPGSYYPGQYPDRYPDRRPDGAYGRYDDHAGDLRGTVASVNPRERLIYVDREGTDGRYGLRNDDRYDRSGTVALSYDDDTVVSYQGRTFRPADLERGDRIQVSVEREGDDLLAQRIDVLYDVSAGNGSGSGYGYDNGNGGYAGDLQGTVRRIDTRNHTLEIDRSGGENRFNSDSGRYGDSNGYGTVVVRYDSGTTVRYQGRDYSPENLESGDVVRIQARDDAGRLIAERIDVLGENGRAGRY